MALRVRIKLLAQRHIDDAAAWWSENRPAAPGAIAKDLKAALTVLIEQPGIGTKVENPRQQEVRRLYLSRVRYFVYYRLSGEYLEVIAFWHESRGQGPRV